MSERAMAQLVGVFGNDPALLRCQVHRLASSLRFGEPARVFGLGSYADDDVLLTRRPEGAGSGGLSSVVRELRSQAVLACAQPPGASFDEASADPFRFRRWLFAMDGALEAGERVRAPLVAALPEVIARQLGDGVDRGLVFGLLLGELRRGGRLDDPELPAADAARSLGSAIRHLDELERDAGATRQTALSIAATNGRVMIAARRGRPLSYALLEGLGTCDLCDLGGDEDARTPGHRRARGVAIASDSGPGAGFRSIPDGSVLGVGRALDVTLASL